MLANILTILPGGPVKAILLVHAVLQSEGLQCFNGKVTYSSHLMQLM
jgi:hypothetical protein